MHFGVGGGSQIAGKVDIILMKKTSERFITGIGCSVSLSTVEFMSDTDLWKAMC